MAGILDSMSSMLTPDVVDKLGKGLGIDPAQVTKGMAITGPVVTGALAKTASTAGGAKGLTDMLASADAGAAQAAAAGAGDQLSQLLGGAAGGDMSGAINGLLGLVGASGGTGADMMQGVLGQGVNAIGGTLSNKLGFDVKPMLAMAVPMVMSLVNKATKEGNLDANGLAKMLETESKAYASDPANKANMAIITDAMAAGDEAAALRGKFSDADWMKIRMAPIGAAYLVANASPSKGKGATNEMAAAASALDSSLRASPPTSLLSTAFGGGLNAAEFDKLKENPPSDESILQSITEARAAIFAESHIDAAAFSSMVITVAERVATATKEGGFLGIGGKQVSDAEAAAQTAISAALS